MKLDRVRFGLPPSTRAAVRLSLGNVYTALKVYNNASGTVVQGTLALRL